ncbi:hypothetical protein HOY82DRAFT_612312 [Tuber indicum]|nr:hypothetical protein HOY82DRAFT_612312 [Tuber indicum]
MSFSEFVKIYCWRVIGMIAVIVTCLYDHFKPKKPLSFNMETAEIAIICYKFASHEARLVTAVEFTQILFPSPGKSVSAKVTPMVCSAFPSIQCLHLSTRTGWAPIFRRLPWTDAQL